MIAEATRVTISQEIRPSWGQSEVSFTVVRVDMGLNHIDLEIGGFKSFFVYQLKRYAEVLEHHYPDDDAYDIWFCQDREKIRKDYCSNLYCNNDWAPLETLLEDFKGYIKQIKRESPDYIELIEK